MRFRIDFASLFGRALDPLFALALTQPDTFHGVAWPILQGHAGGDLVKAQALALEGLHAAANGRLSLVEMPAFEEAETDGWLELAEAFLAGGGDELVAVSGQEVPRLSVPRPEQWPFDTAIRCGASMAEYRQRAIEVARRAFLRAFIAACGGFHRREEAFTACEHANVIVENEAYTRFGPGIAIALLNKLALRLRYLQKQGVAEAGDLAGYQRSRWGAQA